MSGGSYDYIYFKIKDFANEIRDQDTNPLRKNFAELISDVAKVAHDIEWADSGDYSQEDADKSLNDFFSKWVKNEI
jgi:hypothetical protein